MADPDGVFLYIATYALSNLTALIVEGVVQKRNGVVNFVADRVKALAG